MAQHIDSTHSSGRSARLRRPGLPLRIPSQCRSDSRLPAVFGFPDFRHVYEAQRLWPFFALRVIDRKRPDYEGYLARLGLSRDASPLDVLSRSGGEQKGDSVYLAKSLRLPTTDRQRRPSSFAASYATRQYSSADSAVRLRPGDRLMMMPDRKNTVNSQAILLVSEPGAPGVGSGPPRSLRACCPLWRRGACDDTAEQWSRVAVAPPPSRATGWSRVAEPARLLR